MKTTPSFTRYLVRQVLSDALRSVMVLLVGTKVQLTTFITGLLVFNLLSSFSMAQQTNELLMQRDTCQRSQPLREETRAAFATQAAAFPLVRLAYVIPSNRTPQPNGVQNFQNAIKTGQQWFKEQMEQNGFGPKTFVVETEADGVTPLVHVVNVPETDAYLRGDLWGRSLQAAVNAGISLWAPGELWVVIPEAHLMSPDGTVVGGTALGSGSGNGNSGGVAMIGSNALPVLDPAMITDDTPYDGKVLPALGPFAMKQDATYVWFEGNTFSSVASSWQGALLHEMGHAFGLAHDFRNDNNFYGNLMGNGMRGIRGNLFPERYPQDYARLEYASASILNVSHYFNRDKRVTATPIVSSANPGSVTPTNGLVHITFHATDDDLLALAHLTYEGNTVAEIPLQGSSADGTFATPYYAKGATNAYVIVVHDQEGNLTNWPVSFTVPNGYNRAPVPFIQINPPVPGENQSIELNALQSTDEDNAIASVLASWDVDNDGQFDTPLELNKRIQYQYQYGGNYLVRLKLTDPAGGEAISTPVSIKVPGPPPPPGNDGTGLHAEYFNNIGLTGTPLVKRVDSQVDFIWGLASPATGINADNFSVRWTGQVEAPATGNFIFSTVSDDGVRLWVNNVQVVNNWTDHGSTTNNGAPIALVAGTKYDIKMEFYDHTLDAVARLLWAYPGHAQQAIPQSRLYSTDGSIADTEPPSVPASVNVPNPFRPTPSSFILSWLPSTDNVGVTRYEVFRDGVSFGITADTTLLVDNLAPSTTYSMTVRAGDAAGNWSAQSDPVDISTSFLFTNRGTGLTAEYFNNISLTGLPALTRQDTQVDFVWNGSPATGVGADNFSVRWSGKVEAAVTGSFVFSTVSDDGVRLWINDNLVIDNWTDHGPTTNSSAPIPLVECSLYNVRMEFYEHAVSAVARLLWSYPGQAQQVIPQSRLYPTDGSTADTEPPSVPVNVRNPFRTMSTLFILSWQPSTDNVGVTRYEVFRDGVSIGVTSDTTLLVDGLTPQETYSMTVRAGDAAGNWSALSDPVNITTAFEFGNIGTGLMAEYFNNINLTGTPVLRRVDAQVDFTWNASPATGINADNFSVRWSGTVEPVVTGNYVFATESDDGVRLWINGALVINNWTDHGPTTNSSTPIPLVKGNVYDVRMEFYEHAVSAVAKLLWSYPGQPQQTIPQTRLYPQLVLGSGTGLTAAYFNNTTLTGTPVVNRLDAQVDFVWNASPAVGVNADNFSVRWSGQVEPPRTANFTFTTVSDDGVRLWVNGNLIIDNWTDHGPTTNNSAPITLEDRKKCDIVMELYERSGGATARLLWSYAGQAQQVIPQLRLFPAGADIVSPAAPDDLTASNITETSFVLSWFPATDNVGVTGYEILRDGILIASTTDTLFLVDTGLSAGTTYRMSVLARDAAGNRSGTGLEVTTAGTPPVGNNGPGLRAEYFNNTTLTGNPVVTRIDPQVNFQWNAASPAAGINADNFSVRWSGELEAPVSGQYLFTTLTDDGVRLWINGTLVISNWTDHTPTPNTSAYISLIAGRKYPIVMEFYEHGGEAVATLSWNYPGLFSSEYIPQSRLYPSETGSTGTGLSAAYFNNVSLTGAPVVSRVDPQVNFVWDLASPGAGINADNFSVLWTGQIEAPVSGNYVFSTVSDDGVRLWINGTQVINNWTDHAAVTNNSASVPLTAGTRYDVRMEFYDHFYDAEARLLWTFPGQSQQPVPQSRLYPAASMAMPGVAAMTADESAEPLSAPGDLSLISIYPNPASGGRITVMHEGKIENAELILMEENGHILLHHPLSEQPEEELDISVLSRGIHYLKVVSPAGTRMIRLVVE